MIKSMTGFGKAVKQFETKTITTEIRSVNSKQLDLFIKLPGIYKERELELRQILTSKIERGKVECSIILEDMNPPLPLKLNETIIKSYYQQIKCVAQEINLKLTDRVLSTILRLPESMTAESMSISDEEWQLVIEVVKEALYEYDKYRIQEGQALAKDFNQRIIQIMKYLEQIEPYEKERIDKIKSRLHNNLAEYIPINEIDRNRMEQEIIYYIEKLDITEEKIRLKNHCDFFLSTLEEESSNGRKLNFISQEMGREINTIGSKANDARIQHIVVLMKDELEKIKEQLQNIL